MSLKKYFDKLYLNDRWTIGFILQDSLSLIDEKNSSPKIHWIEHHYKDRFFADPFILEVEKDGCIRVLVEEMIWTKAKGTIVELLISTDFKIIDRKVLLEEQVHLSYPFILRKEQEVYVYPESCRNNTLSEYKYDGQKLNFCRVVIDKPLCDSTFLEENGRLWCFCTEYGDCQDKSLCLYYKDGIEGSFHACGNNPVKNDLSSSRPGGDFIKSHTGDTYRIAQDSSCSYGWGIAVLKVKCLEINNYDEEFVFGIYPDLNGVCPKGIHTFNSYKGVTVVDGIRTSKFSPLRKLVFVWKNILKKYEK